MSLKVTIKVGKGKGTKICIAAFRENLTPEALETPYLPLRCLSLNKAK